MDNYDNGEGTDWKYGAFAGLAMLGGMIGLEIGLDIGQNIWDNRNKIINYFIKGKKLVIFGDQKTGKTSLHSFLRKNKLPKTDRRTGREKVPSARISNAKENFSLKIRTGIDIGGAKEYIREWKELFEESDICIYTVNTEKVYKDDKSYIDTVYKHLHHIDQWKSEFESNQDIFIFGLFADKIDGYSSLSNSELQDLKILLTKKLREPFLQIGIPASKFLFGSLLNEKNAKQITEKFLNLFSIQAK